MLTTVPVVLPEACFGTGIATDLAGVFALAKPEFTLVKQAESSPSFVGSDVDGGEVGVEEACISDECTVGLLQSMKSL